MIGKLQRKFVLAAMLSLFIVLGLLIGLINVLNYRSFIQESDDTLSMLAEMNGNPPGAFTFGGRDMPESSDGARNDRRRERNGERPYQARYFSVTLSDAGEPASVDLRNIVTIDEQSAVDMAKAAARAAREKGFSGDY